MEEQSKLCMCCIICYISLEIGVSSRQYELRAFFLLYIYFVVQSLQLVYFPKLILNCHFTCNAYNSVTCFGISKFQFVQPVKSLNVASVANVVMSVENL